MSPSLLKKTCVAALVVAASALSAHAQLINLAPTADTFVYFGVNQANNYGTLGYTYLFANTTIRETFAYYRFDLSAIPGGNTITSASLTFFKATTGTGERNDVMNAARFAVYGLNDVAGNTAQNWGETTLTFNNRGAEWTAANTFDMSRLTNLDGVLGNETVTGSSTSASVSGANLVSFLSGRQAAGGLTTFIVDQPGIEAGRGYGLGTKESADTALIPILSITYASAAAAVPEPGTYGLFGAATLGAILALRRRATRQA